MNPTARFYFFDVHGQEIGDERGEVNTGSGQSVIYKGRHCCRSGLFFRTEISGFRGARITAADFDGRPVLVKSWFPKDHQAPTEFFWLVPEADAENPHGDADAQAAHLAARDSKLDARRRFHPRDLQR